MERATTGKLAEAARAIEELRAQLNEEQVLRRGEHSHHAQLAASVRELEQHAHALEVRLQDKHEEAARYRERHGEADGQLAAAQEALSATQSRCAALLMVAMWTGPVT
jgi:chromosome segregation ATPase